MVAEGRKSRIFDGSVACELVRFEWIRRHVMKVGLDSSVVVSAGGL